MSYLGLARNEETTNSLKTSQIEELKIMRNILFHKYGGKFSIKYQDDIYQLYNAVCIGDRKEEEKRKKRLQHLIRLSTMDTSCWSLVEEIARLYPAVTIFSFREVSWLSVDQTLEILHKVIDEGISIAKMKKLFKECPSPPESATLALQRLRVQAPKERKDRKRKSDTSSNASNASIPKKVELNGCEMTDLKEECRNLQHDIEEKRKLRSTIEGDLSNLHDREVLSTTREKKELERELSSLKDDIQNSKEEKRALEVEVELLKSQRSSLSLRIHDLKEDSLLLKASSCKEYENESATRIDTSMPFATPATQSVGFKPLPAHPAFGIAEEKCVTAEVVEYNNKRVYLGVLELDNFTYCKTFIGKLDEQFCLSNLSANSLTLNKKDVQKFGKKEKRFLILSCTCPIKDLQLVIDNEKCKYINEEVLRYYQQKKNI